MKNNKNKDIFIYNSNERNMTVKTEIFDIIFKRSKNLN